MDPRFYKDLKMFSDASMEKITNGLGIGLCTAQTLVTSLGGSISIESPIAANKGGTELTFAI